eukprot:jgi/Bigna1/66481/fgenesh1_pg.1_\
MHTLSLCLSVSSSGISSLAAFPMERTVSGHQSAMGENTHILQTNFNSIRLMPPLMLLFSNRHVFPSLQKTDFASLMKTAVSEEYTKGTELTKENALNDKVFLIVNGKVTVTKGGKPLYNLTTCQFVGTLGVHTSLYIDKSMSSTEVTSRTLRCLVWSKDDLARAVEGNSRLLAAVDAALSIDELRKTFAAADPAQHELKDGAKTESGRMYDVLVQSMMKEETSVSNRTKNALRRFRILYNVGYDRHVNALQKSGKTKTLMQWTIIQPCIILTTAPTQHWAKFTSVLEDAWDLYID